MINNYLHDILSHLKSKKGTHTIGIAVLIAADVAHGAIAEDHKPRVAAAVGAVLRTRPVVVVAESSSTDLRDFRIQHTFSTYTTTIP